MDEGMLFDDFMGHCSSYRSPWYDDGRISGPDRMERFPEWVWVEPHSNLNREEYGGIRSSHPCGSASQWAYGNLWDARARNGSYRHPFVNTEFGQERQGAARAAGYGDHNPIYGSRADGMQSNNWHKRNSVHEETGSKSFISNDPSDLYPADCGNDSSITVDGYNPEIFEDRMADDQSDSKAGHLPRPQDEWERRPDNRNANRPLSETNRVLRQYLKGLRNERLKLRHERHALQRLSSKIQEMLGSRNDERRSSQQPQDDPQRTDENKGFFQDPGNLNYPQGKGTHPSGCRFTARDNTSIPGSADQSTEEALHRYNDAWTGVFDFANRTASDIFLPWPSKTLRVNMLSKVPDRSFRRPWIHMQNRIPQEIIDDLFQLRKWNAFNFFVQAFNLKAGYEFDSPDNADSSCEMAYEDDRTMLTFYIKARGASAAKLEMLKAQLIQEKMRWHPDRLKRLHVGIISEEEAESAKAVWGAIIDASKACERCMDAVLRGS